MKYVIHQYCLQYTYITYHFNNMNTVYVVIFKGHKFHRLRRKLVECEILFLKKKQWLKKTMYST